MKTIFLFVAMLLMGTACFAQTTNLPKPDMQRQTLSVMAAYQQRKSVREYSAKALSDQRDKIDAILSRINHILEDKEMKYQVTEKIIPLATVFYSEAVLENYSDIMQWIPSLGEECRRLNPDLRCTEPEYEFCEYPDGEYKEHDIQIRHNQAVTSRGVENDIIRFRDIPETKVLSIYHKGPYDNIGEAYAFIMKYAEDNGYQPAGLTRECYIDGIWNKESADDWLTEVQLPVR